MNNDPYNRQNPYSGRNQNNIQNPYSGQVLYNGQPQYNGRPPYNGQPPYNGRNMNGDMQNNQFDFGVRTNYSMVSSYNAREASFGKKLSAFGMVCSIVSLALSVFGVGPAYYVYLMDFSVDYTYNGTSDSSPVFVFALVIFTLLLGIAGIVLSAVGRSQSKRAGANMGGMAVAGLVCGIIAVVFASIGFMCVCSTAISTSKLSSAGQYSSGKTYKTSPYYYSSGNYV